MRRIWIWLSLSLALAWAVSTPPPAGTAAATPARPQAVRAAVPAPPVPTSDYSPGRLLVKSRSKQTKAEDLAKRVGGKVEGILPALGVTAIKVAADQVGPALDTLRQQADIEYAERDPLVELARSAAGWRPNDPLFDSQWALARLGIPSAWDVTRGDPSIIVAVLDTGVDAAHNDLRGQLVPGWDFVRRTQQPDDDNGHGTHVTGIVAAAADNGLGISGVAPGARVMPVKVVTGAGIGSHYTIAQGIEYAVRNHARIINLSLGGYEPSDTLRRAIDYAWDSGALVVAAGGNENTSSPIYPAAWPNVVGVGATNIDDTRAPFSNFGDDVTLVAPGVAILSTIPGNQYEAWPGTSMATPLVSGVAALLWSRYPMLTNVEVRNLLLSTSDKIGPLPYDSAGRNPEYGYGLVNAARAVGLSIVTPTAFPGYPTITPTPCPIPNILPEEQAVMDWINLARFNEGLPPVSLDTRLAQAARAHSQDMARQGRLSHTGSDGSSLQERLIRVGYPFAEASELIGGAEGNPRSLVSLWLNSQDGHRDILLGAWDNVGVGLATANDSIYYYWTVKLASRLSNAPLATPVRPVCPTGIAVTRTPTPRPPTTTPTPTATPPGLHYIELRPPLRAAGWVRSDQPDRGNWGDDDTYTGSLGGLIFHGALQFDLSVLPPNARIQRAQLRLTGQDASQRHGSGTWSIRILGEDADYGWTSHGYTVIHGVSVVETVDTLSAGQIGEGITNAVEFTVGSIIEVQRRLKTTGLLSFRLDGPTGGDNLFSWDTGQGPDSTQPGPVLMLAYALDGPALPTASPGAPTPTPTATPLPPPPTLAPSPTPGPDGSITLQIMARPASSGWLVSSETRGNHLGDNDIYVGLFDTGQYLGAVQFDLSAVPPQARLNWATFFLLGRSQRYTAPGGEYRVVLLDAASDLAWSSLTFARLRDAPGLAVLTPTWQGSDLRAGAPYFLQFDTKAQDELARRIQTTRRLSLRLEGPLVGPNNLFSWNSGADGTPPSLTLNFTPPLP
ncbi:MAG: S8 family serine peptidase [Anaerolineae bacterium]|nr:S8 family serine peptidase [Anaerolineae bacterium]